MDATLYRADGTKENITPANGTDFQLKELYQLLGCDMVEVMDTGDPSMILIGDEEARLKDGFLINAAATRIYREGNGITGDPRAYFNEVMEGMGDAVIFCGDRDEEPYTMAGDMIYCPSVMFQ